MKPIRQGDVILLPVKPTEGNKLDGLQKVLHHLVLAEGEVTGHKHRISEEEVLLYTHDLRKSHRIASGPSEAT